MKQWYIPRPIKLAMRPTKAKKDNNVLPTASHASKSVSLTGFWLLSDVVGFISEEVGAAIWFLSPDTVMLCSLRLKKDNASRPPRPDMNQAIPPEDLICMNDYAWEHPIAVELAYAQDNNALFGEQIYKTGAKLWLHKDLVKVVLEAARLLYKETGGVLMLYDGLRVVEAQEKMLKTQRVKDNPSWLEEPRLLSPPGAGGHPRGMAVDVSIKDMHGKLLDMGTAFDDLTEKAHRNYAHSPTIQENRKLLDKVMIDAARAKGVLLQPLPQEWWDYRLPSYSYNKFAPIRDADLPPHQRLMS